MNIAVKVQTPPATYQDVLDAPENMRAEIIYGQLKYADLAQIASACDG